MENGNLFLQLLIKAHTKSHAKIFYKLILHVLNLLFSSAQVSQKT